MAGRKKDQKDVRQTAETAMRILRVTGNSVLLTLPFGLVEKLGWKPGDSVILGKKDNGIFVKKIDQQQLFEK